jgi:hypothetical protein
VDRRNFACSAHGKVFFNYPGVLYHDGKFHEASKLRLGGDARALLSLATQAWLKAAPGDHPDYAGKIKKLGL